MSLQALLDAKKLKHVDDNEKRVVDSLQVRKQEIIKTRTNTTDLSQLKYFFWLPRLEDKFYQQMLPPNGKWPIFIYLHGSDIRGKGLEAMREYGPPATILEFETSTDTIAGEARYCLVPTHFPLAIFAPCCTIVGNNGFEPQFEQIFSEIDFLAKKHPIDPTRIFVSGLSMGGRSTWDIGFQYHHRLIAIAPVCGGAGPNGIENSKKLAQVHTWIFHGDKDSIVLESEARAMEQELNKIGAPVKITIFPGGTHDDILPAVYDKVIDPTTGKNLYQWFVSLKPLGPKGLPTFTQ